MQAHSIHRGPRWGALLGAVMFLVAAAGSSSLSAATSQLSITYPSDGLITSSPGSIDCGMRGRSCSEAFETGVVVTLTASSSTHAFEAWGGDCAGNNPTCELTMTEDRVVSASFVPVSLSVVVSGYGEVTSLPFGISCPGMCVREFSIGSTITLSPTPDANEQFLGWGGACAGTGSCVVELNETLSVTATFSQDTRFFDLVVVPPEHGYVSSSPGGILCGEGTRNDCQRNLAEGSQEVFSAYPASGYEFGAWDGDCSGTTCLVKMDGDKQVSAVFNPLSRDSLLTVTVTGNGAVLSSPGIIDCPDSACSETFTEGTAVTLTASPAPGETFLGWSGDGCSGAGVCQVTIPATDTQVFASFSTDVPYHLLSTDIVGSGSISSSPGRIDCGAGRQCAERFADGTEVILLASPSQGYLFSGWSGACSGTAACVVTMDADRLATATFVPENPEFTLSILSNGHGAVRSSTGAIDCPDSCTVHYASGATVSLTAEPLFGEQFVGWQGACNGSGSCELEMTADKTVTAVFSESRVLYRLSPDSTNGGSIRRDPSGLACGRRDVQYCYTDGTPLTLSAVADAGYVFSQWLGDCSGDSPCALTVTSNLVVGAVFVADKDTDGDGTPDTIDPDDDNDGFTDAEENDWVTDPLDPDDYPGTPGLSPAIIAIMAGQRLRSSEPE